ncbi:MAG: hypothetical protein RSB15_08860 [Clostridium sp.]
MDNVKNSYLELHPSSDNTSTYTSVIQRYNTDGTTDKDKKKY